jgi:hypothetical protein
MMSKVIFKVFPTKGPLLHLQRQTSTHRYCRK